MEDYIKVFNPEQSSQPIEDLVDGALKCLDHFGDQFNAGNPEGMDDCLHFPHYLLSGNELIVWKSRGQLPVRFFDDLKEQGWKRTVYRDREVLLVSPDKVHFRIKYTREREDGTVITEHENIWILIYKNNRWGIVLRSY
jgi:hypothetical protein